MVAWPALVPMLQGDSFLAEQIMKRLLPYIIAVLMLLIVGLTIYLLLKGAL
jgi:hypothetical protein